MLHKADMWFTVFSDEKRDRDLKEDFFITKVWRQTDRRAFPNAFRLTNVGLTVQVSDADLTVNGCDAS